MSFLERWKSEAKQRLVDWARQFQSGSAQLVYGSLAGLSLWPVFQAAHSGGNPFEIGGALATLARHTGTSRVTRTTGEWRSLKPYVVFFHVCWRFRTAIDEITSKGTSRCLFAARAVHCNSYGYPCPCGRCLAINPLTDRHSGQQAQLIFVGFDGTCEQLG
jgi:hypothetical protein